MLNKIKKLLGIYKPPFDIHIARLMRRGTKKYTEYALGLLSEEAFIREARKDRAKSISKGFNAKI